MDWEKFVESIGGEPVYLPSRTIPQPPLLVLSNDGVSLAEPLYDKIVPILDKLKKIGVINSVNINGHSLFESLESIIVGIMYRDYVITISVFVLYLIVVSYISGKLAKNIHITVGVSTEPNSAIGILNEYFGIVIIF